MEMKESSKNLEKSLALQNIIDERKADVSRTARERRLQDLQIIQSLNSRNNDGIDPLGIFPKEVWEIILSFLYNPEDLENARNSCKLFEDLLEKRRFLDILFPQVLRIKEFRRSLWPSSPPGDTRNPFIGRVLNEDRALTRESRFDWNLHVKLRVLTKSLRDTVDMSMLTSMEEDSSYQFESLDGKRYCTRKILGLTFSPRLVNMPGVAVTIKEEDFYSLKRKMDPTQTDNPAKRFVGKTLQLYFVGLIDYKKYMSDVTSFLSSRVGVGPQIHFFHPHIRTSHLARQFGVNTIEAYNFLQEWALRIPNLKHLYLVLETPTNQIKFNDLKASMKQRPFPSISSLKRFGFRLTLHDSHFETEVFASIMDANRTNLKELVIEYNQGFRIPGHRLNRILISVRALDLEAVSISTFVHLLEKSNFWKNLNPEWPLRKIHLQIVHFGITYKTDDYLRVNELFRILENYYKTTLTHVALDLVISPWWIPQSLGLELPNVTNFSFRFKLDDEMMEGMQVFNSIDYLIPMKNLKELTWINDEENDELLQKSPVNELIKFDLGRFDLYSVESNIWDVFPSLRICNVQRNSFAWKKCYRRELRKMK